jgi:hypothetical protein
LEDGDEGGEGGSGVAVKQGEAELCGGEEIEEGEGETDEESVRDFGGEGFTALEDVVEVGLGDIDEAGEAAFGEVAVADALGGGEEEAPAEESEGSGGGGEHVIPPGNRLVLVLSVCNLFPVIIEN